LLVNPLLKWKTNNISFTELVRRVIKQERNQTLEYRYISKSIISPLKFHVFIRKLKLPSVRFFLCYILDVVPHTYVVSHILGKYCKSYM
jgi:hypothetical protein